MLGRIGATELLLALGVALVVFGPGKLPEIGKAFGRGIREFKDASKELTQGIVEATENSKEVAPTGSNDR